MSSPRRIIIVLLRNDLRIHDQQHFHSAHDAATNGDVSHVLPLYVWDERHVELSGLPGYQRQGPKARTRLCSFWRTGPLRLRFMCEAVHDLKKSLKGRSSDLIVRFGKPEQVVANFVRAFQAQGDNIKGVYLQKEVCSEEVQCEEALEAALEPLNVPLTFFRQNTLVHPDDLPFSIEELPDVFTPFRKRVEGLQDRMARPVLETPNKFKPCPQVPDTGDYGAQHEQMDAKALYSVLIKPLAGHIQLESDSHDTKSAFPFPGGETSALQRLDWYFKTGGSPPPAARYKQTRNHLLGHGYSTKMSPFLCLGSVSPRRIIQYLLEHEKEFGSSQNTYWVQFELLWRDYFLLAAQKYGDQLFKLDGFEAITDPKQARSKILGWNDWNPKDPKIRAWLEGRTGVPFIDANMVELIQSGFMSNRGRQNVASFLSKDLYYDWRIGAEYFESHLIDYEPCANYGNWQYVSGVGNDPRASRQFNPIKQGKDYDIHGAYVKHWLPMLSRIPAARVHVPWLLTNEDRIKYSLRESTYPFKPLVEQEAWKKHYQRQLHERTKLKGNNAERVRGAKDGAIPGRSSTPLLYKNLAKQEEADKRAARPFFNRTISSSSSSSGKGNQDASVTDGSKNASEGTGTSDGHSNASRSAHGSFSETAKSISGLPAKHGKNEKQ